MPTTIAEAFAGAGLEPDSIVKWGTPPAETGSGVYLVALSDSPVSLKDALEAPMLSRAAFVEWLQVRPELTLDGHRPTVLQLMERIRRFWLPDEVILYVGSATSLRARLRQYYSTVLGARRPHAGGYFLKLLENLGDLRVHYAPCEDPLTAEDLMLGRFCRKVSKATRQTLFDPAHPFPFANLEWPKGTRKAHGLKGAREPRSRPPATRATGTQTLKERKGNVISEANPTQRVTAKDLAAGQIRIPSINTVSTKSLFPAEKGPITLLVRGRPLSGSWDPRMGPKRERSGLFRARRPWADELRRLVREDEVLYVRRGEDDVLLVD